MAAQATLVLRDIHQPPAPPWWPPAPGWWLVAAFVIAAVVVWALIRWRRRRRVAAHAAVFDAALAAAETPSEQVAAMSELLRRAARKCDPAADRLQGEAWLEFLDGEDGGCPFTAGAGRLLLDGGYRRDVDPARMSALRPLARARFLDMLERGPASASSRGGFGRAANGIAPPRRSPRRGGAVAPVPASDTRMPDAEPAPSDFRLLSRVASGPSSVSTQAPECGPSDPAGDASRDVTRFQPPHERGREARRRQPHEVPPQSSERGDHTPVPDTSRLNAGAIPPGGSSTAGPSHRDGHGRHEKNPDDMPGSDPADRS